MSVQENKRLTRKVTVREEEIIIAKLKIQFDRLESRLKKLESEENTIQDKVKSLVNSGKKEEAYFWLKKLKTTRGFAKDACTKIDFVDMQIANIENTLDDIQFTQTIKESNKAIETLSRQIDMDEIRLAKELQEDGKMRREEIEQLLADDGDDQDLKRELDLIERDMLDYAFRKADAQLGKQPTAKQQAGGQTQTRQPEQARVAMAN